MTLSEKLFGDTFKEDSSSKKSILDEILYLRNYYPVSYTVKSLKRKQKT